MEINAPVVCPGFQLNCFQDRLFFPYLGWETSKIISHPTWISQFPIPGTMEYLAHGAPQTSTDKDMQGRNAGNRQMEIEITC